MNKLSHIIYFELISELSTQQHSNHEIKKLKGINIMC